MKKKILFAIFTFIFVGISTAFAASDPITLTQADFTDAKNAPETTTSKGIWYHVDGPEKLYILPEDAAFILDGEINLDDGAGEIELRGNTVTLNSNVVLTGGITTESYTDNALKGSGTVNGRVKHNGGDMTIDGSIIFNAPVISNNGDMIINGGTFNNCFIADHNTDVTINDGTFKSGDGTYSTNAVASHIYSSITVNGGTFIGTSVALSSTEAGDIIINGGTFTGGAAGLFIMNGTAQISGGTFKTTGTDGFDGNSSAIFLGESLTFDGILADGYKYTTSTDFSTMDPGFKFLNVSETTVTSKTQQVPAEETTNTETTTSIENPKTGDNIMYYVSVLGLSILGFTGVGIYTKKRFN